MDTIFIYKNLYRDMGTTRFWIFRDQIVMNTASDFFLKKTITDCIYLEI